jgi:LPXTG-site transpeptidase (sortase) family protein
LLGLSLLAAAGSSSVATYLVYEATLTPPPVQSAPDLQLLAGDPGGVYDRPPVTPTPSPMPTPSLSPTPAPPPPPSPPLANTPFRLVIDSIGVNAAVVAEGLDENLVPVVPLNSYQVAWFTFSAQPGTGGNAVFAGHVTWNGRAVFYYLSELAAGDTIRLEGDDGTTLLYTVTDSFMVDENDPNATSVMYSTGSSADELTLISCDGSFYRTNNPVSGGDYTGRRVVRASLTSKQLGTDSEPSAGE